MRRIRKRRTLYNGMIRVFGMVHFLIIVLICGLQFGVAYRQEIIDYKNHTVRTVNNFKNSIEMIAKGAEELSQFLLSADEVQTLLSTRTEEVFNQEARQIRQLIIKSMVNRDYVESISIYDLDGFTLSCGSVPSYISSYSIVKNQEWFEQALEQKGKYLWVKGKFDGLLSDKEKLLLVRVLNRTNTQDPLGMLVITIDEWNLSKLVENYDDDNIGDLFIYDGEKMDYLPSTYEEKYLRIAEDFLRKKDAADGVHSYQKHYITVAVDENLHWKYVYIQEIYKIGFSQITTGFLCVVFCLLVGVAAFLIYRNYAIRLERDMNQITESMKTAVADGSGRMLPLEGYEIEEFYVVASAYNKMQAEMDELFHKAAQEQINRKQAQLESLQAKINPHFLYNTLECINWKAIANNEEEISEMIMQLSRMFQFSLGSEREVPLLAEVENTRGYLQLLKKRFEEKLIFWIEIQNQEQMSGVYLLKFTLQPLVENCIMHGFKDQAEKGIVIIRVKKEENYVEISVSDNGCGVDLEKIRKLLHKEAFQVEGGTHGRGIANVNERLISRYGEESGLRYENRPEGGTVVRFRIKVEKMV